jgi:hypothetical protein
MKVKVTSDNTPQFKPVELSIVVETVEELQYLWHVMNHSYEILKTMLETANSSHRDFYKKLLQTPSLNTLNTSLWDVIDNEMKKQRILP